MHSHQMIIALAEQHRRRLLTEAERHRRIRGAREPRWEDFAPVVTRRPSRSRHLLGEIATRAWRTLRDTRGDLPAAPSLRTSRSR